MSKPPLNGHRIILDNKEFEYVGMATAESQHKGEWIYALKFIRDVDAQDSLESSSHSEDSLVEPFEEQQT